jgi:Domain of Unknown Function (DUF1080)
MYRIKLLIAGLLIAVLTGCATNTPETNEPGWVTLVDGTSLNKWNLVGNPNFRLQDGMAVADVGVGHLVSKETYTDFRIIAEFWVDAEGNSGIFIRCADPAKITAVNCYEVNINDAAVDQGTGTGGVPNYAPTKQRIRAGGQWNTYDITAKGSNIRVVLNGIETLNFNDSKLSKGPITLQRNAGVVKFRKVMIKPL